MPSVAFLLPDVRSTVLKISNVFISTERLLQGARGQCGCKGTNMTPGARSGAVLQFSMMNGAVWGSFGVIGRSRAPMGAVVDFEDDDFRLGCRFVGLRSASRKSSASYIGMHLLIHYVNLHVTLIQYSATC